MERDLTKSGQVNTCKSVGAHVRRQITISTSSLSHNNRNIATATPCSCWNCIIATRPDGLLCRATARARCGAATHDGTSIHGYLNASWAIPRSCSKSIRSLLYNHTPVHSSNGALAHMPLGPMHTFPLDPRSQVDLNSQVDQLTQRVDNQNNLISQLLP
ncbi:hypothetical protein L3X38_012318 [Prunus dulcis]|uniref:Uncharacterized protein n=1 Tax=Prunus dulcis TaxID=3755 RepID=A0AAD4WJT7_PRUDU|nr:hypothetical protein L3X38_012318 [Prunus dulcis]